MGKQRLDTLLVKLNLCASRQQAQIVIRAGEVKVNQQIIDKPGTEVDCEAEIEVKQKPPYVSRGGQKLAKALKDFAVVVEGRICLDGGISTGGFTDCLLQAGAKRVYGVDVGYGQVAWSLRQDSRLVLKERTNLRYLTLESLYEEEQPASLAVVDVSFISLTKILLTLWRLLLPPREAILLVKPQFEVGRNLVGKKGVVRNSQDQAKAIFQVIQVAEALGWQANGLTWSPIKGPAGNIEYLLWLTTDRSNSLFSNLEEIRQITKAATNCLA
ncbi:MAG: TlyA family RNA methyltransferase [Oscillatoria sp. PMC 1068.18]|nr:TlyA family RNA methyltransferase [Oscillatoria sp. PMC 1068.18]